jgi:hypothetical protein
VRALLAEYQQVPMTGDRGTGRPGRDPADRLIWEPGEAAQCDLWFPPGRILMEDGSTVLLPLLVFSGTSFRPGRRFASSGDFNAQFIRMARAR